jgi:hypothetical protein
MPKKKIEEVVADLPELDNVTKDAFPIQYNLEPRFEAIQRNFTKIMEYLSENS